MIAQLFGAALIVIALMLWFVKGVESLETHDAITLGVCIGDLIGGIIAVIAVFGGVVNALGWITVAIYLLLAAGFGYLRFVKRLAA